ncbi:MAG: trypsin-like peptidase domain-containing protein [Planctomycetia bacterium]|nr:trypsin-like peptidase domain-containing protein [Planctomycetia bacterium]
MYKKNIFRFFLSFFVFNILFSLSSALYADTFFLILPPENQGETSEKSVSSEEGENKLREIFKIGEEIQNKKTTSAIPFPSERKKTARPQNNPAEKDTAATKNSSVLAPILKEKSPSRELHSDHISTPDKQTENIPFTPDLPQKEARSVNPSYLSTKKIISKNIPKTEERHPEMDSVLKKEVLQENLSLRKRENELVRAISLARPSVVNIRGEKHIKTSNYENSSSIQEEIQHVNGMGTGVLIDSRGYIVTNFHVVDGTQEILVTTHNQKTYRAKILARDKMTDLAIIKIDALPNDPPFQTICTGTSSDLMIGETVIAVGNPFGYEHTVTKGIISALHRSVQVSDIQFYEDLIQTDASINPGNSGGPLLNIHGEMIGINVAVRAGAQGIGFAIPVDSAMEVITKLISEQASVRHWTGLKLENKFNPTMNETGIRILEVENDSPAEEVGLRKGDILLSVDNQKLTSSLDFARNLIERQQDEILDLLILRDGNPYKTTLRLGNIIIGHSAIQKHQKNIQTESQETKIASHTEIAVQEVSGEDTLPIIIWNQLGLELTPVLPQQLPLNQRQQYNGGLLVKKVRSDSQAELQGIMPGDILLGILRWETLSPENIIYILNQPEYKNSESAKFLILRDSNILYGHFLPDAL